MKKHLFYCCLFLAFPSFIFCQDKQNKFSFGLNINTELSFMNSPETVILLPSDISESGDVGLGYAIGGEIEYKLNQSLFLRTGVNFERSQHRNKYENFLFETDIIDGTTSTLVNTLQITSIGIPLDFGYRFGTSKDKINFLLGLGTMLNIINNTESNATVIRDNAEDEKLQATYAAIDPSKFSALVFGGVEFRLKGNLLLGIESYFKYTPNTFDLFLYQSTAKTKFETGLTLKFKL